METRKPTFPQDWIKPGEFNFCARCGSPNSVGIGSKPTGRCQICVLDAGSEYEAKKAMQLGIAPIVHQGRELLAASRRDAGLPPLFWMHQ